MMHTEYIREGDATKTAFLFIHGFLGSPVHFSDFVALVPEDCAVYNLLLKGHGGTVQAFGQASMAEWKKQADTAVKNLAKHYKDVIIVAHSMGTFFAMEAAVNDPEHIRAILLLQSPLKIGVKSTAMKNTLKSFFNLIPENDTVGKAYQASHSIKLDWRLWLYLRWIPRYFELFREAQRARAVIQKVEIPCYICQSKQDELVSMNSMRFIPEKPNIHVRILEKSAHFLDDSAEIRAVQELFCSLLEE